MKTAYRERDYTFGATMLTLRTAIGLTQDGLAKYLGVSRRAVGEWEAGKSYPRVAHLKELIALAVKQQAWPKGSEAEEIRALWKASHQKVLLNEHWLASLLDANHSQQTVGALTIIEQAKPMTVNRPLMPESAVNLLTPDGSAAEEYIFLDRPNPLSGSGGRHMVRAKKRDGSEGVLIYTCGRRVVFFDAEETLSLHVFLMLNWHTPRVLLCQVPSMDMLQAGLA
jgi:transcriptional regulator with XRE-family HTH domain